MSKTLVLLRHAKTKEAGPREQDQDRELTAGGRADAAHMSNDLKARGIRPDLILASPAARSRETAVIFAGKAGLAKDHIRFEESLYNAPAYTLKETIREAGISEKVQTLLLVAHNPGISELASACAGERAPVHLPPCGMVVLDVRTGSWAAFETSACNLLYFDLPDINT